jgi:ribose/xylose/arabinose/galactoside ABC-type transport system permease subunit
MKNAEWPVPAAVLAGLLTGALCGLINGLMTVKVGLPSFVATLAMMFAARGVNYVITSAYPIYPLPPSIGEFGLAKPLGASWGFWIFVALVLLGDFILRQTIFGSMVTATGGNKQAARVSGINTDRVKIACFMLTGMLAALGGMLVVARIKTAEPQIGVAWELDVIASVVMGGVSFFGGIGTILGTFFGALLMQVVRTGLVVVKVSAHWQNAAVGMLLIVGVIVDRYRRQAGKRRL